MIFTSIGSRWHTDKEGSLRDGFVDKPQQMAETVVADPMP